MKPFHGIVLVLLGLAVLLVQNVSCSADEIFYCADPDCRDSISLGVTLLQYRKRTDKHLSFPAGKQIQILSKPAEPGGSEWVAYLDGKVGLVPKNMVREMRMFKYEYKHQLPFSRLPFWGGPPAVNEPVAHDYVDNPDVHQTPIIEIPVKGAKQLAEEAGQPEAVGEQPEGTADNVIEEKQTDPVVPPLEQNGQEQNETEAVHVESDNQEDSKPVNDQDQDQDAEDEEDLDLEETEEDMDAGKEEFDENTVDELDSANQTETVNIPTENVGGEEVEQDLIGNEITGTEEKKTDDVGQPPLQEEPAAVESADQQEHVAQEQESEPAHAHVGENSTDDQHVNVEVHSSVSESTDQTPPEPIVEKVESEDPAPQVQEAMEESKEVPKPQVISNLEDSEELKAADLEPAIDISAENKEDNSNNLFDSSNSEPETGGASQDSDDEQPTEQPKLEKEQPKETHPSDDSDEPESFGSMFDAVGGLFDGKAEKSEQQKPATLQAASELPEPVQETREPEVAKPEEGKLEDSQTPISENNEASDLLQRDEAPVAPAPEETTEAPVFNDKLDDPTTVPAGFTDTEYDGTLLPVEPSLTQDPAPEPTQQQEPIASSSAETHYSTNIPAEPSEESPKPPQPEATSAMHQSYQTDIPEEQLPEPQQQEAAAESTSTEDPYTATASTTETPTDSSFSIYTGPSSYEKQTFLPEGTVDQPPAEETPSYPESSRQAPYNQLPDLVQDAEKPTAEVPKYDSLPTRDSLYSKFKPDVVPSLKSPPEPEPKVDDVPAEVTPQVLEPEVASPHHDDHDHHDHIHSHGHSHSHGHNHGHSHSWESNDQKETSRIILVIKHISSTLLGFLPEHLQDMVWDCDDALVLTGLIALTLISICVPYLLIQSVYAVKPLKKQVVELNKNLWKVSAAYENQQEEFDAYKQKALAYDDAHDRISQLEIELQVLKDLDVQNKSQIKKLQSSLKASKKAAEGVEGLIDEVIKEKDIAVSERNTFKSNCSALQAALNTKLEELENAEAHASSIAMDLEVITHEKENLAKRVASLEVEHEHAKTKLASESEARRVKEAEHENLIQKLDEKEADLADLRRILHQYEDNVSSITAELTTKENELIALKETLGDDSPLIDISEAKAKLKSAEEEASGLKSRVESLNLENQTISGQLESIKKEFTEVREKKDEAENNLKVLEGWFQKKEDELRAAVAKLEVEQSVKHKDKDDLIKMIRDKESEVQLLISTNEALKTEIEDMKTGHRADLRTVEAKADERWLSLCQAERKLADARKEAEQLRQRLVILMKEKENGEDDDAYTNGETGLFDLPLELVPPPVPDFPTYLHMDPDAIPPPLPLGTEPMRPPPLGRLSPPPPNNYSYMDDEPLSPLSPITRGGNGADARGDYSGGSSRSSSPLDHRRPGSRESWMNENRQDPQRSSQRGARRGQGQGGGGGPPNGPKTSSPIPQGLNL